MLLVSNHQIISPVPIQSKALMVTVDIFSNAPQLHILATFWDSVRNNNNPSWQRGPRNGLALRSRWMKVNGSRCVVGSYKKHFAEAPLKTKQSLVYRMQNLITSEILCDTGHSYIVAIKPSRHVNGWVTPEAVPGLCLDKIWFLLCTQAISVGIT